LVRGSAFDLPFADATFDRVFTSHFYGHLEEHERDRFLIEARRVAPELIVLDAALHAGPERTEWQERELHDGTQWVVYKRFFSEETLIAELGGGEVLFTGTWFICVRKGAVTQPPDDGVRTTQITAAGTPPITTRPDSRATDERPGEPSTTFGQAPMNRGRPGARQSSATSTTDVWGMVGP
jgi:hypothetical protein